MKPRVTQKSVKESYANVISVGYCNLYYLLRRENPRAYTAGIYGWNADIYELGGTAIVTGYRPFGDPVPRELVEKYEKKAKVISEKYRQKKFYTGLFEEEKEKIHALARDFVREAIKEVK